MHAGTTHAGTTKYHLLGGSEQRADALVPGTRPWRSLRPALARAARVWLDAQARAAGLLCGER